MEPPPDRNNNPHLRAELKRSRAADRFESGGQTVKAARLESAGSITRQLVRDVQSTPALSGIRSMFVDADHAKDIIENEREAAAFARNANANYDAQPAWTPGRFSEPDDEPEGDGYRSIFSFIGRS